eukprot:CCRYP_000908-RA/>CCRYP_000908-RA protein AED:0.13 eAED:0.13 QI:975/1/1/1/1/1/2/1568/421
MRHALSSSHVLFSYCCLLTAPTAAFLSTRSQLPRPHPIQSTQSPPSESIAQDNDNPLLRGIAPFEEWFASNSSSGARIQHIRHSTFHSNSLRGLEYTSTKAADLKGVAVVPRKMVLGVSYSEEDEMEKEDDGRTWDVKLSCRLVEECRKGRDSAYYGYCSLLTLGANLDPSCTSYPSTAPDALRHWTPQQKSLLEKSKKGQKLLQVEQRQQTQWTNKYNHALTTNEQNNISQNDFLWAMEAVHSRAFRGDFGALNNNIGNEGGGLLRKLASLLLPLSALSFGIVYATDPMMNQYFVPLAIVAASPVVLTMIADRTGSNREAVLLPLIDSANHLQEADSVIEYDPLVDGYVLSLGRKCLVKEVDEGGREKAQVCISYGIRGDSELLLNYGFLRGVTMEGVGSDEERSEIRKRLAEAYLSRNP